MREDELKDVGENLLETFNVAGRESIKLDEGLKIKIKEDKLQATVILS